MQEVIIDVDLKGKTRIEVNGAQGTECQALTAPLEQALGEVERVELKPEYRQSRAVPRKVGA
jgi:hypothetical protein